ncbi:hypothetical protein O181_010694 [Austropuccinia psidii MF-1]|uniref:Uncharacterized protein n=1 Tax=Austropuccinia psidii MF-1 TaxID=1389203 RepID=A0A9Q3GL43_9BASI|nr:hypothetical protein [Austropuccinia psidii MF-1]
MSVSYQQDDWNTYLPLAEFAYNSSDNSSTKQSLFCTVYGRDTPFDLAHITQDTPAGKVSTKIQSVQQDVRRELEFGINRFKRHADKSRACPPVFNCGDMLASQWKCIHPVFHISLLEPVKTSTIPNQHQEPPPPIIIEEEEEWEISQRLDSKIKREEKYGIWWNGLLEMYNDDVLIATLFKPKYPQEMFTIFGVSLHCANPIISLLSQECSALQKE